MNMRRTTILSGLLALALLLLGLQLFRPRHGWEKKAWIETGERMSELAAVPNSVAGWPPVLGAVFPEVELFDHQGRPFRVSQLKGKPTVIEFLAMSCAACQAWSGAHKAGVFEDLAAQDDLIGIEEYYRKYTPGLELFDGTINFVQLIVYDTNLRAPTPEYLDAWRTHFGFEKHPNVFVVSGGEPLCNRDSFNRIPGFLLLDREGVVRFDALGHSPVHNLYLELLPAVRGFL